MFAQYEHGSVRSSDKMSCSIFEIFDWSEFSPSHKLVPEPISSNQNDQEQGTTVLNLRTTGNEERLEQGTSVHQENGNDQNENDLN